MSGRTYADGQALGSSRHQSYTWHVQRTQSTAHGRQDTHATFTREDNIEQREGGPSHHEDHLDELASIVRETAPEPEQRQHSPKADVLGEHLTDRHPCIAG